MYGTLRTQIGIAKEAVKGTPVAPTAGIVVKKFEGNPKQSKLLDEGWRGSMAGPYGMQNGPRSAEVSLSGDVFADTIGYFLAGLMGDVVTTGAASPFSHKVATLNNGDGQPKSYTLTDTQMGLQPRAYPGVQFTELGFKWDVGGLMEWDAKGMGWISAIATAPTITYGALTPVANWIGAVTLNAIAAPNLQSVELNIKRDNSEVVWGLGSQDPYVVAVGALRVDGKVTFVAIAETPYTQMTANTTPGPMVAGFSQGAASQVNFTMSQPFWNDGVKVTRGKSYAEIEAPFVAVANVTDVGASAGLGPLQATVVNSLPSGTFA